MKAAGGHGDCALRTMINFAEAGEGQERLAGELLIGQGSAGCIGVAKLIERILPF